MKTREQPRLVASVQSCTTVSLRCLGAIWRHRRTSHHYSTTVRPPGEAPGPSSFVASVRSRATGEPAIIIPPPPDPQEKRPGQVASEAERSGATEAGSAGPAPFLPHCRQIVNDLAHTASSTRNIPQKFPPPIWCNAGCGNYANTADTGVSIPRE